MYTGTYVLISYTVPRYTQKVCNPFIYMYNSHYIYDPIIIKSSYPPFSPILLWNKTGARK